MTNMRCTTPVGPDPRSVGAMPLDRNARIDILIVTVFARLGFDDVPAFAAGPLMRIA
jgi:hypothetical protein